jgi:hypothetical protein
MGGNYKELALPPAYLTGSLGRADLLSKITQRSLRRCKKIHY